MRMSPMEMANSVVPVEQPKTAGETTADTVVYTALFDYNAAEKDELSFKAGDQIEVVSTEVNVCGDYGWWAGKLLGREEIGVFPANFVSAQQTNGENRHSSAAPMTISFSELSLSEVIGVGGFGKVHRALWRGQEVAVKGARFDLPNSGDDGGTPDQAILREAKLFSLLRHENVVGLVGVCLEPPNFCLVMQYCRGGALSRVLERVQLPPVVLVDWALQIAIGMCYLHSEVGITIIHRDLKSSNGKL